MNGNHNIKEKLWNSKINQINLKYNKNIFKRIIKKSFKMLVIVEPRRHKHLSGVLKNFVSKIDNNWSMTIFHGTHNYNFIKNIIGTNTNIKLINLNVANLPVREYSKLLLNIDFWKELDAKKILIFQTDCLLRHYNINTFLKYDYIGAPWRFNARVVLNNRIGVGNGGLSLRDRSKCIFVLNKYNHKINDFKYKEDVFFSLFFNKEGFNIANFISALNFSSEQIFSNSNGLHKSYAHRNIGELAMLLNFK